MKINVLVVEPFKKPYVKEIENTLEELQAIVGGYIETYYPSCFEGIIVCNDSGKIEGHMPNRGIYDEDGNLEDIIFGTFFIVGEDGEDFASLPQNLIDKYMNTFEAPEILMVVDHECKMLKIKEI